MKKRDLFGYACVMLGLLLSSLIAILGVIKLYELCF